MRDQTAVRAALALLVCAGCGGRSTGHGDAAVETTEAGSDLPADQGGGGAPGTGGLPGGGGLPGSGGLPGGGGGPGSGGLLSSGGLPGSGGTIGTGSGGAGGGCSLQPVVLSARRPDLLLLVDRSASMINVTTCGQMTCPSRWAIVDDGIQTVTAAHADVRWGLTVFPDTSGACSTVTGAKVPIGDGNAPAIASALAAFTPTGATPTRAAVRNAVYYLDTVTDPNPRYIVLITDGLPSCWNGDAYVADDTGAQQAVAEAVMVGYPVFVVGIAINAAAEVGINTLAVIGGRPHPGTLGYYPGGTRQDLLDSLDAIVSSVRSCDFPLPSPAPNPTDVGVTANGVKVPQDDGNGWSWSALGTTIRLNGQACDRYLDGTTTSIAALTGCP